MSYKYTNIDPTHNRSLYMYCDYEGISFLNSFEKNRKLAIRSAYEALNKNKITQIEKSIFRNLKNELDTNKILENFNNLINSKLTHLKQNINASNLSTVVYSLDNIFQENNFKYIGKKDTIDFIIKSYEIKKELNLFSDNINVKQKIYSDLNESYHFMFSSILIKAIFNRNKIYKYFNTLLKLNDLMIYRMYNSQFINHIFLFYSLILEYKIFNIIKKEKIVN